MTQTTEPIYEQIRSIVLTHGLVTSDHDAISDRQDLYRAGMTSHANINVMVALEDAFDIEFPDEMLVRSTFESITAIREAVQSLLADQVSA